MEKDKALDREYEEMLKELIMTINDHANRLSSKQHIKNFNSIKKMHEEISMEMMMYYFEGEYNPLDLPWLPLESTAEGSYSQSLDDLSHMEDFFMSSEYEDGIEALQELLIYKVSSDIASITEIFIDKGICQGTLKGDLIEAMLKSRPSMYEVIKTDIENGCMLLKDAITGDEYMITDIGRSISDDYDGLMIYARVISFQSINFIAGYCFDFEKTSPIVEEYIASEETYHEGPVYYSDACARFLYIYLMFVHGTLDANDPEFWDRFE